MRTNEALLEDIGHSLKYFTKENIPKNIDAILSTIKDLNEIIENKTKKHF